MSGPLIVDVDTGVDDAIALAFLVKRSPQLLAVTTVAGNVPIDASTANSLKVLAWLGSEEIPVHRGASRPLAVPYLNAAHVHGENGLGKARLPESTASETGENAVEAMLRLADIYSGELTILTLGPLTNLAIALSLRPSLVEQIREVVVMGGAFLSPGNITPHAEFNVYADPHAAQQVFAADWAKLVVLGLDVTHQTVISKATWDSIPEESSKSAQLTKQILGRTYQERGLDGFFLHDPLAALTTVDPEFIGVECGTVDVVIDGPERGRTRFSKGDSNLFVATSVRAEQAEQEICSALDIQWKPQVSARERFE